ncbi:MAG: efflux RND transporter periplasmic adaptor subunit [Pseudomonadales bacterium]
MQISETVLSRTLAMSIFSNVLLMGCTDYDVGDDAEVVRGLKAFRVTETASSELRRYPSVVKPANESKLSFEVAGKLKKMKLEVGQRVTAGDLLAEIDPVSLDLQVQQARASLEQARANYTNAKSDFERKAPLLKNGYITKSEYDNAQSALKSTLAQVEQAKKQLDISKENLRKARLLSPFDGVVSSVDVKDYEQISPGQTILGLYSESAYEISFSVPAVIVNLINVGDAGQVTFSDLPGAKYGGHIKELGTSAALVSAFPVVLALDEAPERLKAGMAADVELDISLGEAIEGYLAPISSFKFGGGDASLPKERMGTVFVFDEQTSTVSSRQVHMAGIHGNMVIVDSGLNKNDIIARAGVSYLRDGLKVKLLPLGK